jgi:hypothetical protein
MSARFAVALAAAALVLAACGGGSSDTSSTPGATTPLPASTASVPATSTAAPATSSITPPVLAPQGPSAPTGSPVDGIECAERELFAQHIHPGLAIVIGGERVTVPANIGILIDQQCLYWLHTHGDLGVIHIESPNQNVFTLGQFFAVWGYPLGPDNLAGVKVKVHAWVAGKPFTGDPATIPLHDLETIVLADADIPADQLPEVDYSEA